MTMNSNAARVLTDLWAIRTWCNEHNNQPPPPAAAVFVDANAKLLHCLIDQVSRTSESERGQLRSQYRELDESVTAKNYGFSIAHTAVEEAQQIISGNTLAQLSDDDVNMIIRSVEYAKYLNSDDCDYTLTLSPIRLPK